MNPIEFPQVNAEFRPPPDLDESQCMTIHAYKGKVVGGSVDGAAIVVVAWQPTAEEIELIRQGRPIFLSMLGGLAPHFLSLDFEHAIRPA